MPAIRVHGIPSNSMFIFRSPQVAGVYLRGVYFYICHDIFNGIGSHTSGWHSQNDLQTHAVQRVVTPTSKRHANGRVSPTDNHGDGGRGINIT